MGSNSEQYLDVLNQLSWYDDNIPEELMNSLRGYSSLFFSLDEQNRYSKPMKWIGMYIALASLICIFAIVGDLIHGFRNKKLWFPCKYFTLNAASLSVIAVAMKLPVDLNNSMPGYVDQVAKLGSMAFMCTMMANLSPSLATMDSKELLTNLIALGVLVITLVVNVCIQINTGVVSVPEDWKQVHVRGSVRFLSKYSLGKQFWIIATIYVVMLLVLLVIHISSALKILTSKRILELKYQVGHESALKDLELKQPGRLLTVEMLKQHVTNHWIMAGTGSPEFIIACSATTSATGVICTFSTFIHSLIMILIIRFEYLNEYKSDYKWSMIVILVIQSIGAILGTIAPFSRCFAALSFKLSMKWICDHIKVFKVESRWTQKLCDWKQSSTPFPSRSHRLKIVIHNLKILILNIVIGLQKTVVIACKIVGLIPIFFVICVLYCKVCWKWIKAILRASGIILIKKPEKLGNNKECSQYVLHVQDDMELAERTLEGITKTVDRLIQKAEKQHPNKLIKLLEESRNFEGVGKYNSRQVPTLLSEEYLSCWSLPLVTLTAIALSLPKIQSNVVETFLSSVSEGLVYVTLVEENLNASNDFANIRKASKTLWLEVEIYHRWFGYKLKKLALQTNTTGQILQWLKETAKNMVTEVKTKDIGSQYNYSIYTSICANSMYRITETILLSYNTDIEEVSQEELLTELSSMIADILAACLTNLPQVIAMKCHKSGIEERESGVHAAAQLLGETMQIINSLQDRELPGLNSDEFPFIDKWRAYIQQPFP